MSVALAVGDIRVGLLVGHRHIEVLRVAGERRPAPEVLSREVNRNLRKADLRDPPFGEVVTELQILQPDVRHVLQIARIDVGRTGVHRTVVAHVARQIGIRALLGPIVLQMPRRNLVIGLISPYLPGELVLLSCRWTTVVQYALMGEVPLQFNCLKAQSAVSMR